MAVGLCALFVQWTGLPADDPALREFEAWEFHPYERGGEIQAIAAMQGTEIHFAIAPNWRRILICRQRTREFLAPLIDRFGFLTTRSISIDLNHRFLSRLGFNKTWDDGKCSHYMLTELPFSKGE